MDIVLNKQARLDTLAAMAGVGGPLNALTLFLFINAITPNRNTTMADLTPATFTGSAPVAGLAWGSPWVGADGREYISAPDHLFIKTGGAVIETVYGWGIATVGLAELVGCALLDTPVPIENVSDGLEVNPVVPTSALAN